MRDGLLEPHVSALVASHCDDVVTGRGQRVHFMEKLWHFFFFSTASFALVMLTRFFVALRLVRAMMSLQRQKGKAGWQAVQCSHTCPKAAERPEEP